MSYIKDDFLLNNEYAKTLYSDYAKDMPIFDYHCHLSEKDILNNNEFKDIFEIWLKGDHYKWRLMRNFGVDEELITGNASNKDKFIAYCKTLGTAFGNPLYHWSQVELKEYFNCEDEINEANALKIWDYCNDCIKNNNITPEKLITSSNVKIVYTTNEIFDDLTTFEDIKKKNYAFKVIPAYRADKIMNIEAISYLTFLDKLVNLTHAIKNLSELEDALEIRLNEFIKVGTKACDVALEKVYPVTSFNDANKVFVKRLKGKDLTAQEVECFKGYLTYFLLKMYKKYNLKVELHIGAMRNNNTVMLNKLGLDTGYDSIAEDNSIKNMSRLFDKLNNEDNLPGMLVFNLNPKMNSEIMTLIGCFQDSSCKGKMQYGAAWWFLDNKVGMEKHLDDLTATGHLGAFVGMLTDSRSFLSYPRHHYFRRILCNYLGTLMTKNLITSDIMLVGNVVKDISYFNAVEYFGEEK